MKHQFILKPSTKPSNHEHRWQQQQQQQQQRQEA